MRQRTLTALVLAAIFIPLLVVPSLFLLFQIVIMILSIIASYELIRMYEKEKKYPWVIKLIIMATSLMVYLSALVEWDPNCAVAEGFKMFDIKVEFLPMFIIVALILFSCSVFCQGFNSADVGKALLVTVYSGLGFASLTILRYSGLRYIIYLFLITMLTDSFAYFFGRAFGKHKISPNISPKKTWEGSIGGTTVATIIGVCFAFFYEDLFGTMFGSVGSNGFLEGIVDVTKMTSIGVFFTIFIMTLLASIFSQIGDLVASRLKRTYEIKDFGRIFPGHGGVLDRLDSALFTGLFLLGMFTIIKDFLPALSKFNNLGLLKFILC